MKLAPGFISAKALAPNRCRFAAVARACTDTMSDSASSSSKLTRVTASGTGRGRQRVVREHGETERRGPDRRLLADVAEAD